MIQQNAVITSPPYLAWSGEGPADLVARAHGASVQPLKGTITLRQGESFAGPTGLEIATLEYGTISLDVSTASGVEFCLRTLGPGDVVIPLDLIDSPAFSLAYRSDEPARIVWLRNRASHPSRAVEMERMMLKATTELLGTCIRMIHELACLPAPHRLYCELLRMASRNGRGALTQFSMPTHAMLATKLCTTRETISRELSFLRRSGVLSPGKTVEITKPDFLLNRLACTLNLSNPADLWRAIGLPIR